MVTRKELEVLLEQEKEILRKYENARGEFPEDQRQKIIKLTKQQLAKINALLGNN